MIMSWRLQPKGTSLLAMNSLAIMTPINIIQIEPANGAQPLFDFSSFICSGFDFQHCAISLHISENLVYGFRGSKSAFRALRNKKLVLQNGVFAYSRFGIRAQMMRVAKYARRGFSW